MKGTENSNGNPDFIRGQGFDLSLISLEDYQGIFRNIFESELFGLAMSDRIGNVPLRNAIFTEDILEGTSLDLSKINRESEGVTAIDRNTLEVTIRLENEGVLKLNRLDLANKPEGLCYFWFSYKLGNAQDGNNKHIRTIQNLYKSFVDSTFAWVFRTSEDDKLLFSNKLFISSFIPESNSPAEINIRELFEDSEVYEQFKKRVILEKKVFNETIHFKKRNGNRLIGLVNCQLHNNENDNPVLSWIVLDISERFEHEEDLQKTNEQLAKVNGQMERFLYSASHDLRSPLTSILGLVNLLRLETKETTILDYVSRIENCTNRLDNIVKNLMSFSRTNYQRIKSEKIDFEKIIWRVIDSHRAMTNFKRILFEVNVSGESPFYSDQDRLEIIFDNLISNAIIFFDYNKVKPIVRINGNISAQQTVLEVIDNGIGISTQHLNNIFNMFYKASERSKGAGLGLYIVKENVQQLKGTIKIESEIGFGSVFRLIIPNADKGRLINRKRQLQAGSRALLM